MLNHVTLEVSAGNLGPCLAFWELLGFFPVALPDDMDAEGGIAAHECGQSIHYMVRDEPVSMQWGHPAIVPPDYAEALATLERAGFEIDHRQPYWGAARCFVLDPQGNRVELLEYAPRYGPRPAPGEQAQLLQGRG